MGYLQLLKVLGPVIVLGLLLSFTAYKAERHGEQKQIDICQAAQQKATETKLTIKGVQDEIRNSNPDDAVTARRLRSHTF